MTTPSPLPKYGLPVSKITAPTGARPRCYTVAVRSGRLGSQSCGVSNSPAPSHCGKSSPRFFETLAQQEQEHFELLERQMDDLEDSLDDLDRLADALRLVIRLEGSEINHVFRGAVSATDSEFVRTLQAFRTAEAKHIAYACDQIPKFEPDLAGECRGLRVAHLSDAGAKASPSK